MHAVDDRLAEVNGPIHNSNQEHDRHRFFQVRCAWMAATR